MASSRLDSKLNKVRALCSCRPNVKTLLQHEFFNDEVPFRLEIAHKVSQLLSLPVPVDSLAPPTPGGTNSSALPNIKLTITFLDGRFAADGSAPAATAGLKLAASGEKGPFEFIFHFEKDKPQEVVLEMVRACTRLLTAAFASFY